MRPRTKSSVRWNPVQYDSKHGYVPRYGADVLKLLQARPGERVLDVGCGTGHLTAQIAESGARVVGLDASAEMIEQAQILYPLLELVVADAASFSFEDPFDAVFSNAALHWINADAQGAVAECVARALRPGGRFVAEFGGKGNIRILVSAIREALADAGYPAAEDPNPWYNPSVGEYASLLEHHGLEVTSAELFHRPTSLDGGESGIRNWIDMFATDYLLHVPPEAHDAVVQGTELRLRGTMYRNRTWIADYRRLRVVAVREDA